MGIGLRIHPAELRAAALTGLRADRDQLHSLEQLAIVETMRELKSNYIIFHLASLRMVGASKRLLSQYATLMRRHPRLRLRIDSHTGVGAPPHIAPQHSVQRALVVALTAVVLGEFEERVSPRAVLPDDRFEELRRRLLVASGSCDLRLERHQLDPVGVGDGRPEPVEELDLAVVLDPLVEA